MKWMIASDLHGSAYWCEKMIERYREEKAGKLILLGDILYHGPRNDLPRDYAPKKVIEMLNGMKEELLCIRGNCDCVVGRPDGVGDPRTRFQYGQPPAVQNRRHPAARSHPHPGSAAVWRGILLH